MMAQDLKISTDPEPQAMILLWNKALIYQLFVGGTERDKPTCCSIED